MRKKEENLNTASGLRIAMILLGIAAAVHEGLRLRRSPAF